MKKSVLFAVVLSILGGGISARADTITFDFNSLANGAGNSSVQSYMNGVLGADGTVTVSGSLASNSYTGDGHVVGPGNGSTSLTLGTSDGTTQHLTTHDTFIQNTSSSSKIVMNFSGLQIYSVGFNYEIFPDGTCATGVNCGSNWPDFSFMANGLLIFETLGVMPGNSGAPYLHSPNSGASGTEKAPQFLGQSGTIIFQNGVTNLQFVDWPATIGIDNLVVTTNVPEPGSLTLFGTGLLSLFGVVRRRLRAKS